MGKVYEELVKKLVLSMDVSVTEIQKRIHVGVTSNVSFLKVEIVLAEVNLVDEHDKDRMEVIVLENALLSIVLRRMINDEIVQEEVEITDKEGNDQMAV